MTHVHPLDVPADQIHPCVQLLQDFWPTLDSLLTLYGTRTPVAEEFAKCIKNAIETYGPHFSPLLKVLMTRLVGVYDVSGESAYLWIARNCVREFGTDERMVGFVDEMTRITFRELQTRKLDTMPDGTLPKLV